MFRRSLLVFVGFLFLVLLLTVGYALTGLSGPETTIQEAKSAFEAGDFEQVIKDLDWLERGTVDASAEVLEEALRMRYRAHLARGNLPQALADLDTLLAQFAPQDLELAAARVNTLLYIGEHERARQEAEPLAAAHPDSAFVLDLTGRACEAVFEADLRRMLDHLSRTLSNDIFGQAVNGLLPYLFRPIDDRIAVRGKQDFDNLLKKFREQDFVVRKYDQDFETIRHGIQRARGYYVRALEAGGATTHAFVGLAAMLKRARQPDALIALAETYLRRFPQSAAVAANHLAQLQVDAGRYRAAHEVVARVRGSDSWEQAFTKQRFGNEVRHLLLADARALHALRDRKALIELDVDTDTLVGKGMALDPERLLVKALAMDLEGRPTDVVNLLTNYLQYPAIKQASATDADPYLEAATQLLAALQKVQAGDDRCLPMFEAWIQARPNRPEPLLERARYSLGKGLGAKALADAARAQELAGQNEEVLQVYAEAADQAQRVNGRDSSQLLAQCITQGTTLPNGVALDALYLPLTERALQAKHYPIALAAARRAAQIYNWARQPRILWATAALRMDDPDEALRALELLRERDPDDAQVLEMTRDARVRSGAPDRTLLFDVAMRGSPDAAVARSILDGALARRDEDSGVGAARSALARFPKDDHVALAAARVLSAFGHGQQAREVLGRLLTHADSELQAAAVIATLLLEAREGGSTEISLADCSTRLAGCSASTLLDLARTLRTLRRPQLAYDILLPVLEAPRYQDARTGVHYLLAGTLALDLGLHDEAEHHLTAALTFEDGKDASRPLTLLLLRGERQAEAADTYWDDAVTDPLSACLAARFGRIAMAREWLRASMARNPSDVCTLVLRHLPGAGFDRLPVLPAVAELVQTEATRNAIIDLLLFTEAEGFGSAGRQRAEALRERLPENPLVRLLHCRALARNGRAMEALTLLTELVGAYPQFTPAYDEILTVRNRHAPTAPLSPEVAEGIFRSAFLSPGSATPAIEVQAARDLATRLMTVNNQGLAMLVLAQQWAEHPKEAEVGAGELDLLLRDSQYPTIVQILRALERNWPTDRRGRYLSLYGTYATRMAAVGAPAELLAEVEARARELVDSEGANGALVQFLIFRDQQLRGSLAANSPRRSPERLQAALRLLHEHVAMFESGRDRDLASLLITLRQLELIEGPDTTLVEVDRLLNADLSLMPLWRLRAELLERASEVDAALATLTRLLDYHDSPDAVIETARLLAQSGRPLPAPIARRFAELEPTFQGSPRARFAAGLVELREGRHEQAAGLLADAEERADGARPFFEALAWLPHAGDAATDTAQQAFDAVVSRYPNSAFAEISAHLSRQLACEFNAASTPAKR